MIDYAMQQQTEFNESKRVLALTPHAPLFGNTSGKRAGTHWLVFMKPPNVSLRSAT